MSDAPTEDLAAIPTQVVDAGQQPDVTDPAKLIRLGTMLQAVLGELQSAGGTTDQGQAQMAQQQMMVMQQQAQQRALMAQQQGQPQQGQGGPTGPDSGYL